MNDTFSSLSDIIQDFAVRQPDKTAYIFLEDGETESVRYTYQQLDRRAKAVAAYLQTCGLGAGSAVLLLYPSDLEFVVAFLGCLYARVVAVPAQLPGPNKPLDKLEGIVRNAGIQLVLTHTKALTSLRRKAGSEQLFTGIAQLQTDTLDLSIANAYTSVIYTPQELAFLQYTSGSTGEPKGVMVSQGNIIANTQTICQAFGMNSDSVGLGWLPFHHDMGLIGNLLTPLTIGISCVLMPPLSFLQMPIRWLKAISTYKATISGGPNFAYDLCIRRIHAEEVASLDLHDWKVAFNGAEPIQARVLRDFSRKFAPAGFSASSFFSCYGMAETTLLVSGEYYTQKPEIIHSTLLETQNRVVRCTLNEADAREFEGCGTTFGDQQVRIVDVNTCQTLDEDRVGEIWVSGSSITQGYWNQPEKTTELFHAYTKEGEGPFLRTGDLGFLAKNRLFVTGRLKDLLIIRGRNYYPQDIEQTIETSDAAIRPGGVAVFSVTVQEEEKVVVVAEVDRAAIASLAVKEVCLAVRQAVARQHEMELHAILLIKPMALPRTTSGKLQRFACRNAYLQETFLVLDSWQASDYSEEGSVDRDVTFSLEMETHFSSATIREWLIDQFARHLKIEQERITADEPIDTYGLTSLTAVQISSDLSQWLQRDVSPTVVYDYPTITQLSVYLSGEKSVLADEPERTHISDHESIAIVGMQCRFPGAADIESYWELLRTGTQALTTADVERWPLETIATFGHLVSEALQKGGFLADVAGFDAGFFGISPREAIAMDPQQRLWLEVCWEALEQAGIVPKSLAGRKVGVFAGVSSSDYAWLHHQTVKTVELHAGTGNALSIIANRLSYLLDLRGPSMSLDTACSSSLVAVHLACQSLRNGESELAIAGGVNLIFNPGVSAIFDQAGMLAKDAQCKVFDALADGYVRGEGCGVVILKRVSEAVRDGDTIYATIKGSAVNQDGRSNGLTAPNGPAQQSVIREALHRADLTISEVGYFEMHGTGTSLGDPIEVNSLVSLLADTDPTVRPWMGSVKANVGHLESAAGIAGLIKAVLCVQHAEIPPQAAFTTLNPQIHLGAALRIPTRPETWYTTSGQTRVAGISSFGFGGTNAHIIIEQAPETAIPMTGPVLDRSSHLLVLSAKDEPALVQLVKTYQDWISKHSVALPDLAFSVHTTRSFFSQRAVFQAKDYTELQAEFTRFIQDAASGKNTHLFNKPAQIPSVALLFTGQGSQYANMGKELFDTQIVFRQAMLDCQELVQHHFGYSLLEVIYGEKATDLHQTQYAQVAIFALEYSLYQLWQSWGVQPSILIGHSIGEYVAACVAGIFSLSDALYLVGMRGKLMQALPEGGKMVACTASLAQIEPYLVGYEASVSIAAANAVDQLVLSGQGESLAQIVTQLKTKGISTTFLTVSHAFHSPLMRPMREAFALECTKISYQAAQLPIISTVSGQVQTGQMSEAAYWVAQVEATVCFEKAVRQLQTAETPLSTSGMIGLELGARPILTVLAQRSESLQSQMKGLWVSSLRPGQSDWSQLLSAVAVLYSQGVEIDWNGYEAGFVRRKISLPTYPFQRKKYWVQADISPKLMAVTSNGLASYLEENAFEPLFEQLIREGKAGQEEIGQSRKIIQQLLAHYQQSSVSTAIASDFYTITWLPQPLSETPLAAAAWIICMDEKGVGEHLAAQLEALPDTQVIRVYAGESYAQLSSKSYHINPLKASDYQKLALALAAAKISVTRLVYLTGYADAENVPSEVLLERQVQQCMGVVQWIQQVIPSLHGFSHLYLVTKDTQAVATKLPTHPAAATLWGLGKSIALECLQWQTILLDTDTVGGDTTTAQLMAELTHESSENQVAWRNDQRLVARLTPQKTTLPPTVIDAEAVYLITGGYGALGQEVTRWLVAKGAKHLIWTGRKGLSETTEKLVADFAKTGVSITVIQADSAISEEMQQVLAAIPHTGKVLKGIFHVAGVLEDGMVQNQQTSHFTNVFRPKLAGAWNLHQLTLNLPLDFFVLFSSAASLLGSPAQSNYAAANAFLDALAAYRHRLNLPATSINWGPWEGEGMAAASHQLTAAGFKKITYTQGMAALEQILSMGLPQVAFVPLDKSVAAQWASKSLFLQSILPETIATKVSSPKQTDFVQKLEHASPSQRLTHMGDWLCEELAQTLRLPDAQTIDRNLGFAEMGMDSMLAVELKNRLQHTLGVTLPMTALFNYATIQALAQYLVEELLVWESAADKTEAIFQASSFVSSDAHEPIAIIGTGCRFPGGVHDLETFWHLLIDGENAITEVPAERWDRNEYYDPTPGTPGKTYARHGGFVDTVADFDADFFGISPREALSMDPQHRILLEVSWEALENAGIRPATLQATQTGIFLGIGPNEYAQLLAANDMNAVDTYVGTGNGTCFSAGRLSYLLGFQGPSIAIDTACSSSLVSTHLACQSLRSGECDLAIAGGVNLMISPSTTIFLSKSQALSPDGQCKTFSEEANGYVRGEGCGMVVLKRLSKAIQDGDTILGVIRGSAVNHDGRSSGLTVPNGKAQAAVITKALAQAQVQPYEISYIEAHGTGTSLGDPIELEALAETLTTHRKTDVPLWVGSVKTNVGHLEAAAGIAGLLKVVAALQHQQIPPNLHFTTPNTHVDWQRWPIHIPTQPTDWQSIDGKRIAGISSFGLSGTNAHIIIEQAPETAIPMTGPVLDRSSHLLVLSAKDEPALVQLVKTYQDWISKHSVALPDLAFSVHTTRSFFSQRAVFQAKDYTELQAEFTRFIQEAASGKNTHLFSKVAQIPSVALLFTGQGSQYANMGKELFDTQIVFRQAMLDCQELVQHHFGYSLLEVIYGEKATDLHQTQYAQVAIFALEYSLYQLWQSWGVQPSVLIGHSIGEYVAACVAGIFSLSDALYLVGMRGKLMQALPEGGKMVACTASLAQIEPYLVGYEASVSIAAANAVDQLVLSGAGESLAQIVTQLKTKGISTTFLTVSHAFHSPLMRPMREAFALECAKISYQAAQLPIISTVSGEVQTGQMSEASYWVAQVEATVWFEKAVRQLQAAETPLSTPGMIGLELGARPILTVLAQRSESPQSQVKGLWVSSLRPGQSDWSQLLSAVAVLYSQGVEIDWNGYEAGFVRRKISLPTYPFQRKKYWAEPKKSVTQTTRTSSGQPTLLELLAQGDKTAVLEQLTKLGGISVEKQALLPDLLDLFLPEKEKTSVDTHSWQYELHWQPMDIFKWNQKLTVSADTSWVLFADQKGIAQQLAAMLERQGLSYVWVEVGEIYTQTGVDAYTLNPTQTKDFQQLLKSLDSGSKKQYTFLYFWALDVSSVDDTNLETLASEQAKLTKYVLNLLDAFRQTWSPIQAKLWLITQQAVQIQDTDTLATLLPSLLWGLGKSIALEYPHLWGGMIDLDGSLAMPQLLAYVSHASEEFQGAFRNEQLWVPRLVRSESVDTQEFVLSPDAWYLVTGGLGNLGKHISRWLVRRGARYLAIVGRTGMTTETAGVVQALEQEGATVQVFAADVSQLADMQTVFQELASRPLAGIVHAAGLTGFELLADMQPETFETMVRAKVAGSWVLHTLSQALPLDFFIGFSSIASVWGSKGQGHYAAGNQFLDTLCHYRKSLGLPATSINWGLWQDTRPEKTTEQALLAQAGIQVMEPALAFEALERVVLSKLPQAVLAQIDWSLLKPLFEALGHQALFSNLTEGSTKKEIQPTDEPVFLHTLEKLPVHKRKTQLVTFLQQEIASVLKREADNLPPVDRGFFEMGFDSLMAMELKTRLEKQLVCALPSTMGFDFPTIQDLTRYLTEQVLSLDFTGQTGKDDFTRLDGPAAFAPELDSLSADAVKLLLEEELKKYL